jgi:hypothetical protein
MVLMKQHTVEHNQRSILDASFELQLLAPVLCFDFVQRDIMLCCSSWTVLTECSMSDNTRA